MTAIGSLVFCNDCGNLLEARTSAKRKKLKCDVCGSISKDTSDRVVVTRSKPSDFPSALQAKRAPVQGVTHDDMQGDAMIEDVENCEKCGNNQLRFYTQQLRSADEGSTVFYTCVKCGHKWSANN